MLLEGLNEIILFHLELLNQYMNRTISPRKDSEEKQLKCKSLDLHAANVEKGLICMLSALLVTYDQIFRNPFGLNKLFADSTVRKSTHLGSSPIFSAATLKGIIYHGLRSTNCRELNITLLQIIYLICEQNSLLGRDELQVITVCVIDRLFEASKTTDKLRKSNIMCFY